MHTHDSGSALSRRAANSRLRLLKDRLSRLEHAEHPAPGTVEQVEHMIAEVRSLLDDAIDGLGSIASDQADKKPDLPLPQAPCKTTVHLPNDILPLGPGSHGMFLRTVIESIANPFLVINVDDFSLRTANAAARACGPCDVTTCYGLTHHRESPCEGEHDPCPLVLVRESGKPVMVEHVHFTEAGTPRNVEVHAHPVFDETGRVSQVIEYSIDITERRHAEQLVERTRDLTVFAMAKLTESRDPETGQHLERMRAYSMLLAEHLAEDGPYREMIDATFLADLYRASPLHDIGKVGIPDTILLKPGGLSDAEFAIMKQHTMIGAEALGDVCRDGAGGGFLTMAAEVARSHHERFDGSGYPDGLSAEHIPLAARIVAVADVYDALTSVRVYKPAFATELARGMVEEQAGAHFDPEVVRAFRACKDGFAEVRRVHDGRAGSS